MKLVDWIKSWFKREPAPAEPSPEISASQALAQRVLGMLANTQEVELTCDEVFALLDQFAEMSARGEDVASAMPLVHAHLDRCGDCREEYEALLNVLGHASG